MTDVNNGDNTISVRDDLPEQNGVVVSHEEANEEEEDLRWGCGPFRPRWLQWLNHSAGLLAILCLCSMLYGMSVNGFTNAAIHSIEKRFHMNSKQTGLISSISHVTSMLVTLFVSYFGSFGNKPRWIGVCTCLAGFGLILFSMPHFMLGRYHPPEEKHASQFCSSKQLNSTAAGCTSDIGFQWSHFFTFLLSQMTAGAGGAALYSLGVAYVDENVNPKYTSLYLAVFYAMIFIGPGLGFIVAGQLLSTYIDITQPEGLNLGPRDPNWIGNWWIGPLVSGFIVIFFSPLIFGNPRQLPEVKKLREDAMKNNEIRANDGKIKGNFKDIIPATKKLLVNPVYMFQTLGVWAQVVVGSGVGPFLFKLVRLYYGATPALAGLGIGFIGVFSSIVGTVVGSFFGARGKLKESCKTSAKYCFFLQIIGMSMCFAFLIPGCDDLSVADPAHVNMNITSHCKCDSVKYLPVCFNKRTHYSPCHAGCPEQSVMVVNYTNCTVVKSEQNVPLPRLGECYRGCKNLYVFLIVFTLFLAMSYFNDIPGKIVTMRSVPENQRAYALGLQLFIWRAFGALPAPVIFGSFIDSSCILWRNSCGEKGDCIAYESGSVIVIIIIASMLFQVFSLVSFLLSWYYACKPDFMMTETQSHGAAGDENAPSTKQNGGHNRDNPEHTPDNQAVQLGMDNPVGASTIEETKL